MICNVTGSGTAFKRDGCPVGASCKPLTLDKDPCENKPALPAGPGGLGICTYGG